MNSRTVKSDTDLENNFQQDKQIKFSAKHSCSADTSYDIGFHKFNTGTVDLL